MIKSGLAVAVLFFALALSSCNGDYSAKPKAYPRVVFPERKYELYDPGSCPFEFEKPVYARVSRDSVYFGRYIPQDQCWLNVNFPSLNGTINLTYKAITDTM